MRLVTYADPMSTRRAILIGTLLQKLFRVFPSIELYFRVGGGFV